MITASHNPYTDNGIKLLNKGYKLTDEEELKIEELMDNPENYDGEIGSLIDESNAINEYLEFIKKYVVHSNLKIAIDCANGATYITAPYIFSKVTDNLVIVANKPDGYNINNDCGSTHLELLKKTVIENKCDLGFAFDGDGDRVLCVDNNGNTVDGDMLIYLVAKYLKSMNKLNNDTIVLSMMSNLGLLHKLDAEGIKVIETPVGDKYVARALNEHNLSVGGEKEKRVER
jgi:phosphoglucosamine mutase